MRPSFALMAEALGPISAAIKRKVEEQLAPTVLKLVNESHKHAGHYEKDGTPASNSGETHFKLEIVSEKFEAMPLVKRHQLVYSIVEEEIKGGVHAFSMTTKTPKEAARSS